MATRFINIPEKIDLRESRIVVLAPSAFLVNFAELLHPYFPENCYSIHNVLIPFIFVRAKRKFVPFPILKNFLDNGNNRKV